ncbi:S-adenosyl-L-methionine-dependent methyltransferase [Mrakia frigida]|uniref:class I SAM-dependent methyltransferase n=1 Tax=Mrakia frigida TaxID=29902 RepID=UPI003FCC159F
MPSSSSCASSSSTPPQDHPTPAESHEEDDDDESDAASTVSFTPSAQALWFAIRGGNTYLAEDDSYWRPVDHVHFEVEEAWDRWKTATYNLVPPAAEGIIKTLLSRPGARVLDVGAGRKALWLIAMAVKYPKAEAIAVDLLPVEDRYVPPNCSFEIWDVLGGLPYPETHFSLVNHSWFVWYMKDKPYSFLVEEIARVLRPGGCYILLEPSNEWACEDDSPLESKFPAIAKFLQVYRRTAIARGSGYMEWKDLKFGKTVTDSKKFSRVVERILETRLGPQAPDDPRLNKAGAETLSIVRAGYRAWVPLLAGYSEEEAMKMEVEVQAELDSLEVRNMGDGLRGKVACLWATRNR